MQILSLVRLKYGSERSTFRNRGLSHIFTTLSSNATVPADNTVQYLLSGLQWHVRRLPEAEGDHSEAARGADTVDRSCRQLCSCRQSQLTFWFWTFIYKCALFILHLSGNQAFLTYFQMKGPVYLDYNATTPLAPEVRHSTTPEVGTIQWHQHSLTFVLNTTAFEEHKLLYNSTALTYR